ncbi:MAG: glutamine-hydrolyzing carbamoyl-phosphate synthase small subunit [Candidatus Tectomicrobia bacterium]|nr:glutamine-hydrolyzing carbamoyl-phosphate synthase small subunit [Candidatus Tectomicrobia bacterium]
MQRAVLALADGTVFEGRNFGASGACIGEVVFNTSMMGYQEILTDPSYSGQIVTMTYPLIGNYGVNEQDTESTRPRVEGFVVRECSPIASSWRQQLDLAGYLRRHGIVGIDGIDTRALTRRLRDHGAQMGAISSEAESVAAVRRLAATAPPLEGRDLVAGVTCPAPYPWREGPYQHRLGPAEGRGEFSVAAPSGGDTAGPPWHVVAYDFGVKRNILRHLVAVGCRVTVVPAATTPSQALALKPDGIFLSNGPGDPAAVPYAIEAVSGLLGQRPIFGICLGHQLLALALGGRTFKLKFGHHGGNHPVMDLRTGSIAITAQNHGFAVQAETLPASLELTHINLNDQTVEGFCHRSLPIMSVQYHPEASPGPHDATYLFQRFIELMRASTSRSA